MDSAQPVEQGVGASTNRLVLQCNMGVPDRWALSPANTALYGAGKQQTHGE